jgi:hypothetical protein
MIIDAPNPSWANLAHESAFAARPTPGNKKRAERN